jgi:MEMO1 family protein
MALLTSSWIGLMMLAPLWRTRGGEAGKIRQPGVSGGFYPAGAKALAEMIDGMLAHAAVAPVEGSIVAAVAPHAAYVYSGAVAACTFAALQGRAYKRVVVIAPSHYAAFGFSSVYDGDGYATPLGLVAVDKEFAQRLATLNPGIRLGDIGHAPAQQGIEHAIEVQLPWLQRTLGKEFTLVPIVMGDHGYESSRALGTALATLAQSEKNHGQTLVLASSDLSHYHTGREARSLDGKILHAMESWDYFTMARNIDARLWEACGGAPIVAAMIYAERLGANHAQVLRYAHSGDVSGDSDHVVGYSADVFVKSGQTGDAAAPFVLSAQEKRLLLDVARRSVESMVEHRQPYEPPAAEDETLQREAGAFVTLTKHGILRGCVGYTYAVKPLLMTVRDTATLAALRDPRFFPVTAEELPDLSYEISVLSPLRHITESAQIEVGRDGLLVKHHEKEGLLLPQVAADKHWDRTRFLQETCHKAGLPADGWKDEETDVFRFTAEVF